MKKHTIMSYTHILVYALLLFTYCMLPSPLAAESVFFDSINKIRRTRELPVLAGDEILAKTALLYARELMARQELSHRDQYGRNALERYRKNRGTAVTIGEIIGSGPGSREILEAWQESPSHNALLTGKKWSHMGVGEAQWEKDIIVVVLFAEIQSRIRISRNEQDHSMKIDGIFTVPGAESPFLETGFNEQVPVEWERRDQEFLFIITWPPVPLCMKVGYLDRSGRKIITDVIYPGEYLLDLPE